MRAVAGLTVLAAAIGAIVWFIGLDVPHAVALAGGVLALLLLILADQRRDDPEWDRSHERGPGGRADVEEIAWSLVGRDGHVRPRLLDRLRRAVPEPSGALAAVLQPDRPVTPAELERALASAEQEER